MYTLRRISGDGVEMNHNLGNQYTVVDKEKNPHDFKALVNLNEFHKDEMIYKFVSGRDGSYVQPLFKNQQAYIMTEGGKTFDNLSYIKD